VLAKQQPYADTNAVERINVLFKICNGTDALLAVRQLVDGAAKNEDICLCRG